MFGLQTAKARREFAADLQAEVVPSTAKVRQRTFSQHHLTIYRSVQLPLRYLNLGVTMVADTLVYHPSVAHYLRYVATTSKSFLITFQKPRHLKMASNGVNDKSVMYP